MTPFENFKNNIKAINLILELDNESKKNYNELKNLFTGFGDQPYFSLTIDDIRSERFDTKETKKYYHEIRQLIIKLQNKGYNDKNIEYLFKSISSSALTAYYTDKFYVTNIAKKLIDDNLDLINISSANNPFYILDPSAGTGIFCDEILNYANEQIERGILNKNVHINFTNIEPENISYSILLSLKNEYRNSSNFTIETHHTKFEKFSEQQKFDIITSNIPFGSMKVIDQNLQNHFDLQKRPNIHSYFFLKSATLLNSTGSIAFITSSGFLDSNSNKEYRNKLFVQNFELKNLIRLPKETFSNTEVQTDFIYLKKSNTLHLDQTINNQVQLHTNQLFSTQENNPNKNKNEIYSLNEFVYNNKKNIYIGEISTNFFFNKYQLSSTLNNQEELKQKFNTLLINNNQFTFNQEVKIVESIAKTEHHNQKIAEGVQLDLFSFEYIEDEIEKINSNIPTIPEEPSITFTKDQLKQKNIFAYDSAIINYENTLYSIVLEKQEYKAEKINIGNVNYQTSLDLVNLKNSYLIFNEAIKEKKESISILHSELRNQYQNFVLHHNSSINEVLNKLFYLDQDIYFKEFKGLEIRQSNGHYLPSDLLNNADYFLEKEVSFDSFDDALVYNMQINNGKLNIREVFTTMGIDDVNERAKYIKIALDSGKLFQDIDWNKEDNKIGFKISTKEDFYSGNIDEKLKLYERYYRNADKNTFSYISENTVKGYIDELRAINPVVLNFEDISINISSEWLSSEYLENFLRKEFEFYENVDFFTFTKKFGFVIVDKKFKNHYNLNRQLAISKINMTESGSSILASIINSESFNFTSTIELADGSKITVKDVKANMAAELKRRDILDKWKTYLAELPEDNKREILKTYNRVFCSNLPKKYNGDYLSFNEVHHIKDINKHQRDAIAMILQNDGGIVDHSVGAGKSLIMFISALKMKKTGLKNKPVIAALNSTAEQIYNEMKLHFPDANIFYETPKAYTKNNIKYDAEHSRKEIFSKIANNDWDCVIMTHEEFVRIPIPLDVQQRQQEDYVNDLRDNFYFLNEQAGKGLSKGQLKNLQNKLETEESKLEAINLKLNENKSDTIFDLRSIGFDHFFIDECHQFKKMPFTTIHQSVAGLSTDTSNRARNMELLTLALRDIVGDDNGLTQLSGTIIENSIAEIYRTIKWQCPKFLEEKNLNTFDRFAKVFFEKAKESELTVGNAIKEKERFRYIVNVPELKAIYNRVSHVYDIDNVQDASIKVDKPKLVEKLVIVEPNKQQEYFNDLLMNFCEGDNSTLKDFERILGKKYNEDQKAATSLIVSGLSLKNGIDARLINDEYFLPNEQGKLFEAAKNIAEFYYSTNEFKGVQLVFSDNGVPNSKDKEKFNAYDELSRILVERYDIPKEEIQYAQNWKGDVTGSPKDKRLRNEFSQKANDGEFRIIFGSTKTLGTGRNVQKRVVAMHDLDIPWRPTDSTQRAGRGARQGNLVAKQHMNNEVIQFKYLAKKSLDAFRAQANEVKDKFLKIFKNINNVPRIIDEGELDADGNSNNFSLMKAYILDNPEMLEVSKIEKKLETLYQQKEAFKNEEIKINRNISMYESSINNKVNEIENYSNIWKIFSEEFANFDNERFKDKSFKMFDNFNVSVFNNLEEIKGFNYKDVGQMMRKQFINTTVLVDTKDFNRLKPYLTVENSLGKLYNIPLVKMQNFEMNIRVFEMKMEILITSSLDRNLKFVKRQSVVSKDPVDAFSSIFNEINTRVPNAIERAEYLIEGEKRRLETNLKAKEKFVGFGKDKEIEALQTKLADLKFSIELKQKNKGKDNVNKI